jgi:hypothetical protein
MIDYEIIATGDFTVKGDDDDAEQATEHNDTAGDGLALRPRPTGVLAMIPTPDRDISPPNSGSGAPIFEQPTDTPAGARSRPHATSSRAWGRSEFLMFFSRHSGGVEGLFPPFPFVAGTDGNEIIDRRWRFDSLLFPPFPSFSKGGVYDASASARPGTLLNLSPLRGTWERWEQSPPDTPQSVDNGRSHGKGTNWNGSTERGVLA